MIARIPMTADLAEWIGNAAECIENRSLLLEKFCFHKSWPPEHNERGQPIKRDEASRWSLVRIAAQGDVLLRRDAKDKRDKASGRNIAEAKAERLREEANLVDQLARTKVQSAGIAALRKAQSRRWLSLLQAVGPTAPVLIAGKLESRMAINLADGLIQNAGICIDRLFGMPYIPGSAIKGVCRHAALAQLREAESRGQEAELVELIATFVEVFGCSKADWQSAGELAAFAALVPAATREDRRGSIIFLPAYPLDEATVEVDLTNVHYPDYYKSGKVADLAEEKPLPNPFPTVGAGTHFLFGCLPGPQATRALLVQASEWLKEAIKVHGVGAKTASGYGWFSIAEDYLTEILKDQAAQENQPAAELPAAREQQREAALAAAVANLTPLQREMRRLKGLSDQDFAQTAKDLANAESLTIEAFLTLLRDDKDKRDKLKTWRKKKPKIADAVQALAQKLNFTLP